MTYFHSVEIWHHRNAIVCTLAWPIYPKICQLWLQPICETCKTIHKWYWIFFITRAKARVINSLRVIFFAQVSHAVISDSNQSLQIVVACDYSCLSYWQFPNPVSDSSHLTSCSSIALQVNCALSVRQKLNKILVISCVFKVDLTCVINLICVNIRLLGMRV